MALIDQDDLDYLMADLFAMSATGTMEINAQHPDNQRRVKLWERAVGWGWLTVDARLGDPRMMKGRITETGRLTLQPNRPAEPIEGTISPWMPITDPIQLAVLGKLGEECCELGARLFRTVIQGLDEKDPGSKRLNREEIAREIADVEACIQTIKMELRIDYDDDRVNGKRRGFLRWFQMIRDRLAI